MKEYFVFHGEVKLARRHKKTGILRTECLEFEKKICDLIKRKNGITADSYEEFMGNKKKSRKIVSNATIYTQEQIDELFG